MISLVADGLRLAGMLGVRAAPLLACLSLAGCFYVEVINLPPVARIERLDPLTPLYKDGFVMLTARGSVDQNGDELVYEWEARSCAGDCAAFASDVVMDFRVQAPSHDPIRVTLRVSDEHGAFSSSTTEVQVLNRLPTVLLQAQGVQNPDGSYPVQKPIVFAAAGSDLDGDRLGYRFAVHPPPQSPAGYQFSREQETSYKLTPDAPGLWEVEVTVDDGYGGRATARRSVTVAADAPPCVASTTPSWSPDARVILVRAAGPRRFSVDSITDDLDPWPGSPAVKFRWLLGPAGEAPVELAGHDLPDLAIDPAELDSGELLSVRVEISDRTPRVLPCAADQAACSLTSSTCFQRLTWTAEVR